MERHWKSVVLLLLPVMTWGWLVTSLFIWWLMPKLTWLESLACAACVTATDPVLASSVVGKGKFAKRVPKHLRDLLSAESGCNDGMAFPFIYLALYLIQYRPDAGKVIQHWVCITILYECVFGAIYGAVIGLAGRHAIKYAEKHNLVDRESFLVFYFVLALWCAGTGSMLGLDDLLVGFSAGVAFSNDGWFSHKTEESHVSNVIDLLLNLAFFVYFGSIIPWSSYNNADWGISPWRLVVISLLVILFRRIPIMVMLKPVIPDIKTWREALFAGHFGPIGVGAIFVAILARAELEHEEVTPLEMLPEKGAQNYLIIELIWPITTFLVLASIVIHGSSIAVFTLGKHINTMRITMSYTTANDDPSWISRLPRLTPRASMSIRKPDPEESSSDEKARSQEGLFPPGTLPPPGGVPGGLLNRRSEGDQETPSRPASVHSRRRRWEAGQGPGGPISESAIKPQRSYSQPQNEYEMDRDEEQERGRRRSREEVYQEGPDLIIENQEGDVIGKTKSPDAARHHHIGPVDTDFMHPDRQKDPSQPAEVPDERTALSAATAEKSTEIREGRARRPAVAYRIGDSVIVEDEDGEVIKRYKLPKGGKQKQRLEEIPPRPALARHGSAVAAWGQKIMGQAKKVVNQGDVEEEGDDEDDAKTVYSMRRDGPSDKKNHPHMHFRMHDESGKRLNKQEFLKELQRMDPHARASITPTPTGEVTREELRETLRKQGGGDRGLPEKPRPAAAAAATTSSSSGEATLAPALELVPSNSSKHDERDEETVAERKRREAALGMRENEESDSDSGDDPNEGRLERRQKTGGSSSGAPPRIRSPGIRFADSVELSRPSTGPQSPGISWGDGVKGKGKSE